MRKCEAFSSLALNALLHNRLSIILQLQNHWITRIMAFTQLLSICYQKTFENAGNPHKYWILSAFQLIQTLSSPAVYWSDRKIPG